MDQIEALNRQILRVLNYMNWHEMYHGHEVEVDGMSFLSWDRDGDGWNFYVRWNMLPRPPILLEKCGIDTRIKCAPLLARFPVEVAELVRKRNEAAQAAAQALGAELDKLGIDMEEIT